MGYSLETSALCHERQDAQAGGKLSDSYGKVDSKHRKNTWQQRQCYSQAICNPPGLAIPFIVPSYVYLTTLLQYLTHFKNIFSLLV